MLAVPRAGESMTRKRIAQIAAVSVFAIGMVGFYFFLGAIKGKFSDTVTYVIAMAAFLLVFGIGHLTETVIYQPPAKPPFDPYDRT